MESRRFFFVAQMYLGILNMQQYMDPMSMDFMWMIQKEE